MEVQTIDGPNEWYAVITLHGTLQIQSRPLLSEAAALQLAKEWHKLLAKIS